MWANLHKVGPKRARSVHVFNVRPLDDSLALSFKRKLQKPIRKVNILNRYVEMHLPVEKRVAFLLQINENKVGPNEPGPHTCSKFRLSSRDRRNMLLDKVKLGQMSKARARIQIAVCLRK